MGCDIHILAERLRDDGTWEIVKPPRELQHEFLRDDERCSGWGLAFECDRNYGLFGALAGVRRNDAVISPPRGLPRDRDDLSSYSRASLLEDAGGCHSFTHYYLSELEPEFVAEMVKANSWCPSDLETKIIPWLLAHYQPHRVRLLIGFDS